MSVSHESEIRTLVAEIFEIRPEEIKPDSDLKPFLAADSIVFLEIFATLEKQYGIKVEETDAVRLTSFRQLVQFVEQKLAEKPAPA